MSIMTTLRLDVLARTVHARSPVAPPASKHPDTCHEPGDRTNLAVFPWLTLCPAGTIEIDARAGRRTGELAPGTPVALRDDRPLSRRRLRRLARRLSIAVEREVIVLPTTGRPIVMIDDTEHAVRHFWTAMATVPPGLTATAMPATMVLRLARSLPWRWTGAAAPGRVLIGRKR